ncbi:MAG: choice-of-anchor C family protein [Nitrospira sp.]
MSAGEKMTHIRLRKKISQLLLWQGLILLFIFTLVGNATAQTCLQPPAGLVGWWPGDGNADAIAGENSGTLHNGATFVPGRVGQAFRFNDAFQQFVRVPHGPSLDIQHELTIDAWIMKKGSCEPLNCWIVAKGNQDFSSNTQNGRYGIFITDASYWPAGENGTVGLSFNTGSWEDVVLSTTIILDNSWYHVAGTWDGITAKIYVNGILEKSVPKTGTILPSLDHGSLAIGAQIFGDVEPPQGEFFNGLIDEVEVYNRALTAAEIQAIFNAGSSGKCKAPSLITNGGFEQGTNPGPSFITLPAGSTAMTNWVVTSGTVDYIGPYWTAASGQRSVDLNGNDPGAISQVFKTHPGTTYAVRFAMAGNPDGPPTTKRLHVSAGEDTAELTFNTEGRSRQEMGYEKRTVLFTATSSQTTLAFTTLIPGPYGPAIDDVTVNETALGNVDNQVHFTPESRSYKTTGDATGCPSGFIGKFSFTATLGAKPTSPPLSSLVVKVAQLSNGNLLQNADGGPSGAGGLLTIPRDLGPSYNDGILTQGEKIQHIPFTICLTSKASFSFFVDVLATTGK